MEIIAHSINKMRLILWVILTKPLGAQIFDHTLFWVFLGGCFGLRLTFKSIDWVKLMALQSVGGPHPIS